MPSPDDDISLRLEAAYENGQRILRECGMIPSPAISGEIHPLASAGIKLKDLRVRSGWTAEEIADRTGISLDVLTAFEEGGSGAAGTMTVSRLERLASACCGSLADLLQPGHPWMQSDPGPSTRGRSGGSIDPWG